MPNLTNKPTATVEDTDAELVSRSLAGDRDSFNRIVLRYQTLICSLAYNALGDLGLSEDVAQDTFVTAWKQLARLREPAKLRAWLCGIVRNRIHKDRDRAVREPVRNAEPLDQVPESAAAHAWPSDETIGKEEQALLWRSLQNIPEVYREPLILFYREHLSVAELAQSLDLTEEAARQRLSRGRKLLQEEVQGFVERTLRRTAPGEGFSAAVLAALPTGPMTVAGAGAASKGAAMAKSGLLGMWLAPLVGIGGGLGAHWLIIRAAPTARERRLKTLAFAALWVFVLGWSIAGQLGMSAISNRWHWSRHAYFCAMAGFWWFYAAVVAALVVVVFHRICHIREAAARGAETPLNPGTPLSSIRSLAAIAGIYVACFWWVIYIARRAGDWPMAVGITGVMAGLALNHFVRLHGKRGAAATRALARRLAIVWGVILLILNYRLRFWVAHLNDIEPAEMNQLLPAWLIPLLTLCLAAWVAAILFVTRLGTDRSRPSTTPADPP